QFEFADYVGLGVLMTVVGLLVIVSVLRGASEAGETHIVILVFGLAKASESLTQLLYGILQGAQRLDYVVKSMILRGSLATILFTLAVLLTGKVAVAAGMLLLTSCVTVVAHDLPRAVMVLRGLPCPLSLHTAQAVPLLTSMAPRFRPEK